jgi:Cyclic nucleotide-binding domain.
LSHTDANGNTWIVGYSFANDFVCDYPSFMKQTVSTVTIQASTECEVYLLPLSKLNQFWETDMDTQRLGRQIAETMFAEIYQRLLGFYCDTPEQRYHALMKRCPGLQEKLYIQRNSPVLGITPKPSAE